MQPSLSRQHLGVETPAAYASGPQEAASSFAPPLGPAGSFVPPAAVRAGSKDIAAHANQIFNPPHLHAGAASNNNRTRSPAKPRLSGHASPGMIPPTASPRDDHQQGLVTITSVPVVGQGLRSASPMPPSGSLSQRYHGTSVAHGHASDRHSASPAVRYLEQGRMQEGRRHGPGFIAGNMQMESERTACGAPRTPLVASRDVKKRQAGERPGAGAWKSAVAAGQQPTVEAEVVASQATTMASEVDEELPCHSQQHVSVKKTHADWSPQVKEGMRSRRQAVDRTRVMAEPRQSCSSEETIPESRDCAECVIDASLEEDKSRVHEHLLQRERDVAGREKLLLDREDQLETSRLDVQSQQRRLEDWRRRLQEQEDKLRDRDQQIESKLSDREQQIASREAELVKAERRLADRETDLARREAGCCARELEVQSRDLEMQRQAHRLQEEEDRMKETKRQLDEREHRWLEAHRDRDGVMLTHTAGRARMSPRGKENYALQRQLEEQREMVHQIKRKNNSWSPEDGLPTEDASQDNFVSEAASPDLGC
eukprot:TRINITY_DN105043_c0_g1_i1.p1 TRINITY_DN105043_c0_g1~~TRINITY_DN105043_c0_g1_i1.p1  ORF type:complete len:625 (+),score=128.74 TRINITY_DN105043_c0_g1_i1:253-1875(+)